MFRRILAGVLLCSAPVFAQVPTQSVPPQRETIEVTATRIAEDVTVVPASITIIDGEELRARNATDLASALAGVAGLSAVGGSDAGPNAGVPEMWGLREVDAFLLVVDGVPWGGAFNPDLPTVDLTGVDRIEVVRGSAPVMYGATSFVGVIHVIHRPAGAAQREARFAAGNYGSGGVSVSLPLAQSTALQQSLIAGVERRGFRDDRSEYDRGHVLYRLGRGNFHLDADATLVRQEPGSPHPRQGPILSAAVPLDANHNPDGARLDENRLHLAGGLEGKLAMMPVTATLALTRSTFDIERGFLAAINNTAPNAAGYRQDRDVTDVYFDAHTVWQRDPALRVIAGVDHLYGSAKADSELFDYFAPLSGNNPDDAPVADEETELEDTRNFSGLYAAAEWTPRPRWRVAAGLRVNRTHEQREGEDGRDSRTVTRPGGSIGVNWLAMQRPTGTLTLFADYRNTFKPAAIDFGPDAEGEILEPETATSIEAGLKAARGQRIRLQMSVFAMNFHNLVVPTIRDGHPALENAGNERFTGFETEVDFAVSPVLRTDFAYSYHDARFRDYVRDFDGVLTQLRGKRFEMSPLHMVSAGFIYAPATRLNLNAQFSYVGERYLNKRNTAIADAYSTWSMGVGWRTGRGEFRVDGRNLNDQRPAVAESELGDAQYYRLAARSVEASYRMNF